MLPWNIEQRLLRPLLWLPSDQLDHYIKGKSFAHREDSSNQKLDYTRNRLRSIVLAELEHINPKAVEHIWTVSQDLRSQSALPALPAVNETPAAALEINPQRKSVDIHKLGGISELRMFLLDAAPELVGQLTREKLANIFMHLRKLAANPTQCEGYKIALSERSFVLINSKQLEIKVTS
jgi:tRNA(Ile)-lysidine synthase TilS/MesJ